MSLRSHHHRSSNKYTTQKKHKINNSPQGERRLFNSPNLCQVKST